MSTPTSVSPNRAAASPPRRPRRRSDTVRALLFLSPALFFVVVLFLIPLGYNVVIGFYEWSAIGSQHFVGLLNYERVLTSDRFWNSLSNTVMFALLSVPTGVVLSLLLALGFNALPIGRSSGLIRALYFAPVVASLTAVAFVWVWIFNPAYGIANALFETLGIPAQPWLTSTAQALPSLSIMYIWSRLGFNMIILLAGLQAIDKSYYEAARLDGAGRLRTFFSITLPLLNRQLVLVISVEVMNAFKLFDLPFVATRGGPVGSTRSLVMEIYEMAFRLDRWGEAAVYVTALFVLLLVITAVIRKLLTREVSE